jgi:4-hydroxy-3-methylbut-2-enyl diphosphate reductase
MKIVVAEHSGFCFGVRRAVDTAKEETRRRGRLYSQGPLIHNKAVVDELREEGLEPIDDVGDAPEGAVVMLRTHGVGPSVYERALERGLTVIDATCPFVGRAQREAAQLHEDGYQVLVLGEPEHPEAQAIRDHTGGAAEIISGPAELDRLRLRGKVAVVCQTTQRPEALQALVDELLPRVNRLAVANTICDATAQRQAAALRMAKEVDFVVVIGGKHSANTTRLAEICAAAGKPTRHVEDASEIQFEWFDGVSTVGVTAGASTPDSAVQAVIQRLKVCGGVAEGDEPA